MGFFLTAQTLPSLFTCYPSRHRCEQHDVTPQTVITLSQLGRTERWRNYRLNFRHGYFDLLYKKNEIIVNNTVREQAIIPGNVPVAVEIGRQASIASGH